MTQAERMRAYTEQVSQMERKERMNAHKKFAEKALDKIRKRAKKGFSSAVVPVKKNLSSHLVGDAFSDMGFAVGYQSKNGKQFVQVSW